MEASYNGTSDMGLQRLGRDYAGKSSGSCARCRTVDAIAVKVMLLAAGRGQRMGELTAETPKPLLQIGAESLIERQLRRLADAGFSEFVINLSYRGDQIRREVGDGRRWGIRIAYSQEPEPPLEAAGGIVRALPLLGHGPFLLVNADIVTDFPYATLELTKGRGLLVLVPNPPHHRGGDFSSSADGLLQQVGVRRTFAGISILHTDFFIGLGSGRRALKPLLDAAIDRQELYGTNYDGFWLDVGTSDRLRAARAYLSGAAEGGEQFV